jgi:hypothetical protein
MAYFHVISVQIGQNRHILICTKYLKSVDFDVKQNNILQTFAKSTNCPLDLCVGLKQSSFSKCSCLLEKKTQQILSYKVKILLIFKIKQNNIEKLKHETRLHLRKMLCHRINTTLRKNRFFCFYTIEDCHNA